MRPWLLCVTALAAVCNRPAAAGELLAGRNDNN